MCVRAAATLIQQEKNQDAENSHLHGIPALNRCSITSTPPNATSTLDEQIPLATLDAIYLGGDTPEPCSSASLKISVVSSWQLLSPMPQLILIVFFATTSELSTGVQPPPKELRVPKTRR